MCLGLNQGSMSSAFNYYPMCNVGTGTWIGEESFFMETTELSYSIKTVSTVKVLEIGLVDFYDKMPPEIIKNLRTIALKKQFSKIMRMKEIAEAAKDLKEREEMHKFHAQALTSLIRMHPHASKRIMTSLGHQF